MLLTRKQLRRIISEAVHNALITEIGGGEPYNYDTTPHIKENIRGGELTSKIATYRFMTKDNFEYKVQFILLLRMDVPSWMISFSAYDTEGTSHMMTNKFDMRVISTIVDIAKNFVKSGENAGVNEFSFVGIGSERDVERSDGSKRAGQRTRQYAYLIKKHAPNAVIKSVSGNIVRFSIPQPWPDKPIPV